jgi:hypothetical protein
MKLDRPFDAGNRIAAANRGLRAANNKPWRAVRKSERECRPANTVYCAEEYGAGEEIIMLGFFVRQGGAITDANLRETTPSTRAFVSNDHQFHVG